VAVPRAQELVRYDEVLAIITGTSSEHAAVNETKHTRDNRSEIRKQPTLFTISTLPRSIGQFRCVRNGSRIIVNGRI